MCLFVTSLNTINTWELGLRLAYVYYTYEAGTINPSGEHEFTPGV
jgi:hypothetical protein